MKLIKDNLCIRNATLEDAKLLCTWWNDGRVMAHAGFPNGLGKTEQSVIELISNDESCQRLILEIDSIPIGEANYRSNDNIIAEIGIKICNSNKQGKGYGTIFLKMLINELFRIGYSKIILDTNLNNKRAQHVYEKLGFKKVGIRFNSWEDQLGDLQSAVDYELTIDLFVM